MATAPTSLPDGRMFHATVKLSDGRVMICGGMKQQGQSLVACRDTFIYDPVTSIWSGTMAMPYAAGVFAHQAVLMENGRVLVVGGYDPLENPMTCSIEFDSTKNNGSGLWANISTVVTATVHSAVAVFPGSNSVVKCGGHGKKSGIPADACKATKKTELYDTVAKTWAANADMTFARFGHSLNALTYGGGTISMIAWGGLAWDGIIAMASSTFGPGEIFNGHAWANATNPSIAAGNFGFHRTVAFTTSTILVYGGTNNYLMFTTGALGAYRGTNRAILYDIELDTVNEFATGTDNQANPFLAKLDDGRVISMGGDSASTTYGAGYHTSHGYCDTFYPSTTQRGPYMNRGRWDLAGNNAVKLNDGTVFVVGGREEPTGKPLHTCELFTTSSMSWLVPTDGLFTGSSSTPSTQVAVFGAPMAGTLDYTTITSQSPRSDIPSSSYYAKNFTFTLDQSKQIAFSVSSSFATQFDSFLYVLTTNNLGTVFASNNNSLIANPPAPGCSLTATLPVGTYCATVTTYDPRTGGDFTLQLDILALIPTVAFADPPGMSLRLSRPSALGRPFNDSQKQLRKRISR